MNQNVIIGTIFLFVCLAVVLASPHPRPDEEHYFDKEDAKELAGWLATLGRPSGYMNLPPCRPYYYENNYLTAPMPKRNSELINSLLSLPKTMNDAGK